MFATGSCADFDVRLTDYPRGGVEIFLKNGENSEPGWHPLCKEGFSKATGDDRRALLFDNDKGKLVEIKRGVVQVGTSGETLVVQDVEWSGKYFDSRTVKGDDCHTYCKGWIQSVEPKPGGKVKLQNEKGEFVEFKNPGQKMNFMHGATTVCKALGYDNGRPVGLPWRPKDADKDSFKIGNCREGQWGLKHRCDGGQNQYSFNTGNLCNDGSHR